MPLVALTDQVKKNFIWFATPYAIEGSRRTGIFTNVILAQWCHETRYGTSKYYMEGKNFAGIKVRAGAPGIGAIPNSTTMAYADYKQALEGWIFTIKRPYYKDVAPALTVLDQIKALGLSPWSEGHYGIPGQEGINLIKYLPIINTVIQTIESR